MKPKILVSRKISDGAEEILKQEFDITLNLKDKPYPYEELIKLVNNYDGLIFYNPSYLIYKNHDCIYCTAKN